MDEEALAEALQKYLSDEPEISQEGLRLLSTLTPSPAAVLQDYIHHKLFELRFERYLGRCNRLRKGVYATLWCATFSTLLSYGVYFFRALTQEQSVVSLPITLGVLFLLMLYMIGFATLDRWYIRRIKRFVQREGGTVVAALTYLVCETSEGLAPLIQRLRKEHRWHIRRLEEFITFCEEPRLVHDFLRARSIKGLSRINRRFLLREYYSNPEIYALLNPSAFGADPTALWRNSRTLSKAKSGKTGELERFRKLMRTYRTRNLRTIFVVLAYIFSLPIATFVLPLIILYVIDRLLSLLHLTSYVGKYEGFFIIAAVGMGILVASCLIVPVMRCIENYKQLFAQLVESSERLGQREFLEALPDILGLLIHFPLAWAPENRRKQYNRLLAITHDRLLRLTPEERVEMPKAVKEQLYRLLPGSEKEGGGNTALLRMVLLPALVHGMGVCGDQDTLVVLRRARRKTANAELLSRLDEAIDHLTALYPSQLLRPSAAPTPPDAETLLRAAHTHDASEAFLLHAVGEAEEKVNPSAEAGKDENPAHKNV
ncbi:MAG TPA: hypothetical protein VKV18_11715 [Chthonomonas sp.]|uniref:hypothetical protein n=1 Tax=Chthonomonas sp. TaxID=2282153 RepID=UPI002B4AE7B6|nr:hypothetical protein [Chthonomonas sp.]HLI49340.1 hypothetical protein [Chthonomonas sp.]